MDRLFHIDLERIHRMCKMLFSNFSSILSLLDLFKSLTFKQRSTYDNEYPVANTVIAIYGCRQSRKLKIKIDIAGPSRPEEFFFKYFN